MKVAAICIILVIAVLALAGPAAILVSLLTYVPPEPAVYEGSILDFYEENADLLNAAAESLWLHPEFFDQRRIKGEYDSVCRAEEVLNHALDHSMFTDEEWRSICQLFEQTEVTGVYYYYGSPPKLHFFLWTTQDRGSLHYIRTDGYTAYQVAMEMSYYAQYFARFGPTAYPCWYAGYQEED